MIKRIALMLALIAAATTVEARPYLLILQNGNGVLDFYDPNTMELKGSVTVGKRPNNIYVGPAGKYVYVADYGSRDGGVAVVDIDKQQIVKHVTAKDHFLPYGIVLSPDEKALFVTAESNRAVAEVDMRSGKLKRSLATGENLTRDLAIRPDGRILYALNKKPGNISVFDLKTGERLKHIFVSAGCDGITMRPDGKELWATDHRYSKVVAIDTETHQIAREARCPGYVIRVAFTPDSKTALVSSADNREVVFFDVDTMERVGQVGLNARPATIAVDDTGSRAFVIAPEGKGHLFVIDIPNREIEMQLQAGPTTDGIAYVGGK